MIIFNAYSKSLAFSLQISFTTFICLFKKYKNNEKFFILGYLFISQTIAVLKEMVVLLTLNSVTILANFSFSLNLLDINPW